MRCVAAACAVGAPPVAPAILGKRIPTGGVSMPDDPHAAALTLREAQADVDATILALGGYWPPLANLARLFEECGELARAVNQTHGPKQLKPGEGRAAAREELGDVLYVLLVLANSLGIEADDALAEV